MFESYFPILLATGFALILATVTQLLGSLIGPSKPSLVKGEPFECGIPTEGAAGNRYSVRFFLVAALFLLFDVEAVFLFPWATVFLEYVQSGYGLFIFFEMAFFLFILLLGWFYVWKKGALKWE